MKKSSTNFFLAALGALALLTPPIRAWDHEGHRIVNQLALAELPADFPAFVRESGNADRVAFLANAPDRWRNVDPLLRQSGGSWTDHFFDIEQIEAAGLDARTVPSLRYDFALQFAVGRATHLDKFPAIDPAKNADHTREWPGFAPWAIAEYFAKLRSAFGYLKAYQEMGGTLVEVANAQADVVYVMGVMGHYVGDCAQPLHTTVHHAGWVGPNPNGYTTWPGFHSWIDGGFIAKAGIKTGDLAPRLAGLEPFSFTPRADGRDAAFVAAMDYIIAQNELVEPLYKLEKAGLMGHGEQPITAEARTFIEGQLLVGAQMLAKFWLTAWKTAPVDTYLRAQLAKRMQPAAPATAKPAAGPKPATEASPATAPGPAK